MHCTLESESLACCENFEYLIQLDISATEKKIDLGTPITVWSRALNITGNLITDRPIC